MTEAGQPEVGTAVVLHGASLDDGVIDPRETRSVLARALAACSNPMPVAEVGYGVFRM